MGVSFGLAGCTLRTLDRTVATAAGVLIVVVGERRDGSLAVGGALVLAALHPFERAMGGVPCLALFGVAGRHGVERLTGVGDLVAVAVVGDQAGGVAPGAAAADAVGEWAERLGEVGGLVDLGGG